MTCYEYKVVGGFKSFYEAMLSGTAGRAANLDSSGGNCALDSKKPAPSLMCII